MWSTQSLYGILALILLRCGLNRHHPCGSSFVSATNGGTESGGVVTWNVGNLGLNEAFTALVTARVNTGTQGQTLVNAVSAVNDQNPDAVTDTCDVTVNDAPLTITKTVGKAQYDVVRLLLTPLMWLMELVLLLVLW